MSTDDWRYSDERMDVRTQGLNILFKKNCVLMVHLDIQVKASMNAFMTVQGNATTSGIVAYYKAYYADV